MSFLRRICLALFPLFSWAWFLCFLALLGSLPVFALDPARKIEQYGHDVWQQEQGLPQNSIWATAQTPDGYLWFGTEEGLVRFDGVTFKVFDKANTPEIHDNTITALWASPTGTLWIGTIAGGLSRMDHGRFTAVTVKQGLPSKRINFLVEEGNGGLWVGTEGGLAHGVGGVFHTYGTRDGLASERIWAMHRDRAGRLWVGTSTGLFFFEGGRFRPSSVPGLAGDSVMALCEDLDGGLWIGSYEGKLWRMKDEQVRRFSKEEGFRGHSITSLTLDRRGSLWIGTRKDGLLRYRDGYFETYGRGNGLSDDWVLSLFEDPEGSLWVGTYTGGLNRFRDTAFATLSTREGLSQGPSTALLEDHEEALWVGTAGGSGLSRFKKGKAIRIGGKSLRSSDVILSLAEGPDGSLWIGTMGGLDRYRNGQATDLTATLGLSRDPVFSLLTGQDGSLWIGAAGGGLKRLQDGKLTSYGTAEGLSDLQVLCLLEGRDRSLWIGTQGGGVARLWNGTITTPVTKGMLSGYPVFCLLDDQDGSLWMGLQGGGLRRWKDGKLASVTMAEGLYDNSVFQILDDGHGNFWMSCNKGIFRANKRELAEVADGIRKTLHCVSYGVLDGMLSAECNGGFQPAGWKARDGRLLFPTTKGVAVVDPARLPSNTLPPPVHIEEVLVDQHEGTLDRPIRIPPGTKSLEIRYTALSFVIPERVRFEYRLEGYDREWVQAGTRRVAYYTSLPPGTFRFQVRACNNDGVWNLDGASVPLKVEPQYYQTLWFYSLCGLLAVAFGALIQRHFHQVRVHKLELQNRVLNERHRLARDVHDQLSQTMTGLLLQLEAAGHALLLGADRCRPYLVRAAELAREGIAETRRTVQGLRATALDDGNLVQALEAIAHRLTEGTLVQVEVGQMGSPFALPRSVEDDLFRVGQEGITNALRHGHAHRIEVFMTWEEDGVRMSIRDDGLGMDTPTGSKRSIRRSWPERNVGAHRHGQGHAQGGQPPRRRYGGGCFHSTPGGGDLMVGATGIPKPIDAPSPKIRVLIVDDHPLVREGLRAVLDLLPDFEVAGEAADGEEAILLFQSLKPDVTVMDLRLPKCSGLDACRAIRKLDPLARILALTSSNEGIDVRETLAAGAVGFLLKGSSGPQVAECIRSVHAGETPVSPEALELLVHLAPSNASTILTNRELEILDLVARGLLNQEIADQLSIAIGTVKVHINNILDKLGARSRTEAAMLAIKKGMIRL